MKTYKMCLLVAVLIIVSLSFTGAALAENQKDLQIIGSWRASEGDAFERVLDGFRESTGINVTYEGVPEVLVPLTTRVAAGNPPDLAILPVAQGLLDLQAQNALIPLDEFTDELKNNFSNDWLDLFTVDGHIYAFPTRANVQNCLWYNPETVTTIPNSWTDLINYCDANLDAESCFAGIGKTSWTLTVLFPSLYVSTNGLEKYNALIRGEIPFTDESVVDAFERVTTFYGDKYTFGGATGALGTDLVDGISLVFGTNPKALFLNAGSWADGIAINAVNQDLVETESIDYMLFPGEPISENTIIASTDVVVLLSDSPEARALLSFLMSAEGQSLFAPFGYPVANRNVDPSLYIGLSAKTVSLLGEMAICPDISMVMTNENQTLVRDAVAAAVLAPDQIESILDDLENTLIW